MGDRPVVSVQRFEIPVDNEPETESDVGEHETIDKLVLFLDDNDLSLDETFLEDATAKYKLMVCVYKFNDVLDEPFLEYYFIKENGEYTFPSMDYVYQENSSLVDSCSPILEQILDEDGEPREKIYKGFIKDAANSIVFVVFELTGDVATESPDIDTIFLKEKTEIGEPKQSNVLDNQSKTGESMVETGRDVVGSDTISVKEKTEIGEPGSSSTATIDSIWAIIDEIVYYKSVRMILFHKPVCDFFQKNSILTKLSYLPDGETDDETEIDTPYILYMCQDEDGSFDNIYESNNSNNGATVSLINEQVEHPFFGSTYLFSERPINPNNVSNIKRYAVFTYKPLYIPCIDLASIDPQYDFSEYKDRNTYFTMNDMKYWSIKDDNLFVEL